MSDAMPTKELTDVLKTYMDINIALTKHEIVERGSQIGSSLISGMLIAVLGLFFLLLISFGLGFLLGQLLDDVFLGFTLIACIYLVFALFLFVYRKRVIQTQLRNKLIDLLMN